MRKPKPSQPEAMLVEDPIVLMFLQGREVVCILHPPENSGYQSMAIIACDLIRHIAKAFNVPEELVWKRVEQERDYPREAPRGTIQ